MAPSDQSPDIVMSSFFRELFAFARLPLKHRVSGGDSQMAGGCDLPLSEP